MLGFKSTASAATILSGIEMVHTMRKRQARYAYNLDPSLAEQFEIVAAWIPYLINLSVKVVVCDNAAGRGADPAKPRSSAVCGADRWLPTSAGNES